MKSVDYIFENLKIVQDDEHLKYGTDALLLSAFARGGKSQKAVDLGSGNGVIALAVAYTGKAGKVVGIEIQHSSAELFSEGIAINKTEGRVSVMEADFTKLPTDMYGSFDYALSNPPYMKTSGKSNDAESKNIARHEINCDIYSVCEAAGKLVKFGGNFFLVYRPDRISELFAALRENKFEPKRMTFVCARPELAPCLVLVEAKKNGSYGCNVTPVFFISDEEKMKSVYDGGSI